MSFFNPKIDEKNPKSITQLLEEDHDKKIRYPGEYQVQDLIKAL